MASGRVIRIALRAAPVATLAALALWVASEALSIGQESGSVFILEALAFGMALLLVAAAFRWTWPRPIGLGTVATSYGVAHAFFLGVQLLPALVFLVFLICHVELGILQNRFAPLLGSMLTPADLARIRAALGRAVLRLSVAAVLAVLVPLLAANLALSGVVALTTVPSALALAGGLIIVVLAIVLLPRWTGRENTNQPNASDAKAN